MDGEQAMETGSFLEELKQKLDRDMDVGEVREMRRLMKDKLGFMYDSLETELASDLVTFLENSMTRSKVVSILKHVLDVMRFHGWSKKESFYEWIDTYQTTYGYLEDDNFVGRQKDIQKICDTLITETSLGVWIYGFGGVGKTTLAREIGTRMARKRGIQFKYVDLKQTDTPSDMYRTILRKFGCSSHETDLRALQRRMLTLFFEEVGTETWLLLDNIQNLYDNHKQAIEGFLCEWMKRRSQNKVKLLVTSRNELDANSRLSRHICQYPLKALDDEASLRFLKTYCKPADLDSDQYIRIMECCGNIPLAMLLLSNTISQRAAQGCICFNINSMIRGQGQINECIEYAFDKLDKHMQTCLVQLAVLDVTRFSALAVCEVLGVTHEEAVVILMQLCHRDMIQKMEYPIEDDVDEDTNMNAITKAAYLYFFHELVLQFLIEKQGAILSANSLHACHVRFATWMFSVLKKSYGEYFNNNLKCIEFIHTNAHLFRTFFKTLDPSIKEHLSVIECAEIQMASAVILSSDVEKLKHITSIKSKYCSYDSTLYWDIEDAALSIDSGCLKDAGTMISKIENDIVFNNRDRSIVLTNVHLLYHKGRLLRKQGDLTSAEQTLRTALDLLETENTGEIYCVSKSALILNALGNVAHDRGKKTHDPKHFDNSLDFHTMAVETLKAVVGNQAHREMSLYTFNIGTIAFAKYHQLLKGFSESDKKARLDYLKRCLTCFDESIEDDMKLGLQDQCDFAEKLHIRYKVHIELKDFDRALHDVKESNAIRHKLMEGKHPKKLLSRYYIGRIYIKQREQKTTDLKERTELLKKAKTCFDEVCSFIQKGDLTKQHEGVTPFLADYAILARATGSKVYIAQVEKFCLRVEAGKKATSSTDTTSSSSEEEPDSPHGSVDEDNERKDSGVHMDISSAEVGEPATANGQGEQDVFMTSFQRMSSDEVFMSDGDDVNTSDLTVQTVVQKRKRGSDSE